MSADADLRHFALQPPEDLYALLSLPPTASDSEIRRAYRKTALKYHPDKVGATNVEALAKFHSLSIANEILSSPELRQLYDHARKAKEEKRVREEELSGRRRAMKEDLERRESGFFKRKREDGEVEREVERLAEDGKRRRKEMEERLRRARQVFEEAGRREEPEEGLENVREGPTELDRSITLRWPVDSGRMEGADLTKVWSRFGEIQDVVMREKRLKKEGGKHRVPYFTAVIVYSSIVGAHAAVSDFPKLQSTDPKAWSKFEAVGWAAGKEPDCIPKPVQQPTTPAKAAYGEPSSHGPSALPSTPQTKPQTHGSEPGLRKAPSFASFKGSPAANATPKGANSPSLDEITMIRLKNAERRRLEERIRRDEAEAAAAASGEAAA